MMVKTDDLSWEIHANRITDSERVFPEMDNAATSLMSNLRSVRRLYGDDRIPDRRLFGLDIANLADGLSRLADLRQAGITDPKLTQGLIDMKRLAEDMRSRAQEMIHARVEDALTHTSIATLKLRDTPVEITLSATPPTVLSDSETQNVSGRMRVLISDVLSAPKIGGQITGEWRQAQIENPLTTRHVSREIFFLPENRVLSVEAGQSVILWEGAPGDPVIDVLQRSAYQIESVSGDVQIQGPVFVSQASPVKTSFLQIFRRGVRNKKDEVVERRDGISFSGEHMLMGMMLIMMSLVFRNIPGGSILFPISFSIGLFIVAKGVKRKTKVLNVIPASEPAGLLTEEIILQRSMNLFSESAKR